MTRRRTDGVWGLLKTYKKGGWRMADGGWRMADGGQRKISKSSDARWRMTDDGWRMAFFFQHLGISDGKWKFFVYNFLRVAMMNNNE